MAAMKSSKAMKKSKKAMKTLKAMKAMKAVKSMKVTKRGSSGKFAETRKIQFLVPNPKVVGSDAFKRYQKYMKAQTIGEALKLGAHAGDLQWDRSKGFLKFK
eukprot:TRINITY_DN1979_c0_g1_i1.p2 TRINITY_DN1979_c0_g1~~TRINITY_DN1979_c0_g1_i1.p2  ORF type:complete len:102 (+),score=35.41 TRINITY_DN1979_c0_g1_i1:65-370(+)